MPFGYGQRRCPGKDQALLEAFYFIARLAIRFKRIESCDDREWVGEWKLIVRNLHGCKIVFWEE